MALLFKILFYVVLLFLLRRFYVYLKKKFGDYKEEQFLSQRTIITMEVLIPPQIERSPMAMENMFSIIHGTLVGPGPIDYYFYGIREYLYVFELVGREGIVRYFLNIPLEYKELVRSALYSNFPTIEIKDVDDWKKDFPTFNKETKKYEYKNIEYQFKGGELVLNKPAPYPIKTYLDFGFKEKFIDDEEEGKISDPFAHILEALGATKKGEMLIYQLMIMPASNDWKEEGLKLRDKLLGRAETKTSSGAGALFGDLFREVRHWIAMATDYLVHFFTGQHPGSIEEQVAELKKQELFPTALALSKREMEIIHAIERTVSKLGFTTYLRLGYVSPKAIFDGARFENLQYAFRQFNTIDLNSFSSNSKFWGASHIILADLLNFPYYYELWWKHPWLKLFNKENLAAVRQYQVFSMLLKKFPGKSKLGHTGYVLNVEELATIFHFPGKGVVAPYIKRVEAKHKRPPLGLPKT